MLGAMRRTNIAQSSPAHHPLVPFLSKQHHQWGEGGMGVFQLAIYYSIHKVDKEKKEATT